MQIQYNQTSITYRFGAIEYSWNAVLSSDYSAFTLANTCFYCGVLVDDKTNCSTGLVSSDAECEYKTFTISNDESRNPSIPATETSTFTHWDYEDKRFFGINASTRSIGKITCPYDLFARPIVGLVPDSNFYIFPNLSMAVEYINKEDSEKDTYASEHALNYDEIQINLFPLNTTFGVYRNSEWKPSILIKWKSEKIGGKNSKYSEEDVQVVIRAYQTHVDGLVPYWNPELPTDDSLIPAESPHILYSGRFSAKKYKFSMTSLENYSANWWVRPAERGGGCIIEMYCLANDGVESRHTFAYFTNIDPTTPYNITVSPYKVKLSWWNAGFFHTETDDISIAKIENGDGESDDGYDTPPDTPETPVDPTPYQVTNLLNSSYALTKGRAKNFANYLWTAGVFDNIRLMNQSPIENVVSCKFFPFTFTGTDENIVLGNVKTSSIGAKMSDNATYLFDIGTLKVKSYYNSFLDYSPYTQISIFLPFIGIHELDSKLLVGKNLNVKYAVDVICGSCKALLSVDGVELYSFDGNMGIDIPVTSGTRSQVEKALINGTTSSVANAIGQNWVGVGTSVLNTAMSGLHNQSSGSHSSATSACETLAVYLIYDRPIWQDLAGFNHEYGRRCNLTKNLATLDGFTKCSTNIELSGIVCTQSEKDEIKDLLTGGVFL